MQPTREHPYIMRVRLAYFYNTHLSQLGLGSSRSESGGDDRKESFLEKNFFDATLDNRRNRGTNAYPDD